MPRQHAPAMALSASPVASLVIQAERPDQPQVQRLLAALDDYLASLYAPEHNHILDLDALLAPSVRFIVARIDGRAVGCAAVRHMPGEAGTQGEAYGEIKRMMVDPMVRRQGVGAALLEQLERGLRASGLRWALLETGAEQTQAVELYRRSGYLARGAFAGYPDNGLSLFMEKHLAP